MAGYIGSVPVPQATETRDVYTATSNQTTFTTGGYTPNFVSVYLNGVHLARADYTATNGSDVVLAVGAAADDTVEIVSFATFEVSAQTFTGDVTASGGTFLPTGDTAAGDDAAVGYTAAEGLILTGQGTTNDVTIKNDADADVIEIPTGTVNVTMAGTLGVTGVITSAGLTIGSAAITEAELEILDGATVTTAELNLIDGGTSRGTTAIADGDGVLINDAGTMRQTSVETLATYMGTKGLGPSYTRGATVPSSPNAGDWWNNTGNDSLYIYDATDGWITNSNHTFGTGTYQVPGNYSLVFTGGINRVSFQGASVGTQEDGSQTASTGNNNTTTNDGGFALSNSVRGVFGTTSTNLTIAYVTMATSAAALDFGNLVTRKATYPQAASHQTRGLIIGGSDNSEIDYITIASAGNALDFGDLTTAGRQYIGCAAMTSTTRAIFKGGSGNVMDYVTVANTGNATDFGDVSAATDEHGGANVNSTTRGIISGNNAATNAIEYITMGTAGNSTDFGDMTSTATTSVAVHSSTTAYINKGDDVITMATAANATASGYEFDFNSNKYSVMPGWIAYNG
tara:strand:+ start:28 stop:1737 length:1710 start_codon:yes stop_codon:yes gene_type:complete